MSQFWRDFSGQMLRMLKLTKNLEAELSIGLHLTNIELPRKFNKVGEYN